MDILLHGVAQHHRVAERSEVTLQVRDRLSRGLVLEVNRHVRLFAGDELAPFGPFPLGLLLARTGRKEEADKQLATAKSLREEDDRTSRLQLRLLEPEG